MMKSKLKKLKLPILLGITIPGCLIIVVGILYLFWPGPDTLVINDTSRSLMLNNCGDAASSIPPGDVWDLKPGDQVSIPSSISQKGNVCDVNYDNVQHSEKNPGPDACLPLPPHGGGFVHVSDGLKPYPIHSNDLCDAYIKF